MEAAPHDNGRTQAPPAKREKDSRSTEKQEKRKQHHPLEVKEGSTTQKETETSPFFHAVVRSPPRCVPPLLLMVLRFL